MKSRALAGEFIGTFTLIAAILSASLANHSQADGLLTLSLLIGLSLIVMTHALFNISGAHFNPAVTLGLVASGHFDTADAVGYVIAQTLGALAAAALFIGLLGATGTVPLEQTSALINGYGDNGRATLLITGLIEILFMALFMIVYMGSTSQNAFEGSPAIAIGLGFALLYLTASQVSSASLNPARSSATILLAQPSTWAQLWLFWVGPITGGIIGGLTAKWLFDE